MRTAFKKHDHLSPRQPLFCCLCGTKDYDKLMIHELGLAAGHSGEDYSFCKTCWMSNTLGEDILGLLGFEGGMLLKESCLEISEAKEKPNK